MRHGFRRDWIAGVGDRQFKCAIASRSPDLDRRIRRTIRDGVAEQIGEELADPLHVAIYRLSNIKFGVDRSRRVAGLKFRQDLLERLLDRIAGGPLQRKAATKAAAREI